MLRRRQKRRVGQGYPIVYKKEESYTLLTEELDIKALRNIKYEKKKLHKYQSRKSRLDKEPKDSTRKKKRYMDPFLPDIPVVVIIE
jgi:hypothetical protein